MPSLESFFSKIKNGDAVRASVPLLDAIEKPRLNCFYGAATPPSFTLAFPFGVLVMEQVDTSRPCTVLVDFTDQSVSISADILQVMDSMTLELVAREMVSHAQSRNYFRVDATTRVAASSTVPEELAREGEHWKLLGDTIDLSGSGLLCSFSEPLPAGEKIKIELTLPSQDLEMIQALGHVVRCRKVEEQIYHIALQFDLIEPEAQDKIMAYCFELQRRHLRMRVRVEQQKVF